jgi:hypothetical protein
MGGFGGRRSVLKKKGISVEQKVGVLKQAQVGVPVVVVIRKVGISEQTFLPMEGEVHRAGSGGGSTRSLRRECAMDIRSRGYCTNAEPAEVQPCGSEGAVLRQRR